MRIRNGSFFNGGNMTINKYMELIMSKYEAEYDHRHKILTFNKPIPVNEFKFFKDNSKHLDIDEIRVERKLSIYERGVI